MRVFLVFLYCVAAIAVHAQKKQPSHVPVITSGPMIGHVELRTATIWVEFSPDVKEASITYVEKGTQDQKAQRSYFSFDNPAGDFYRGSAIALFNTARAVLINLKPGTTYTYRIYINRSPNGVTTGEVTTQQLWQYRQAAPDFSFLTGSCAYFNQPLYDRPGKPYGSDSVIFQAMAREKADFMLWLGDNWYTREVDFYSSWGLHYRASRDRSMAVLQPLLKAMPHYAVWDDHDYGWNNADKSYPLKETSRQVFMKYWANPSYGESGQGIYSKFTWNDVDIFLLDSRWFRSNDSMADSVNGQPNPGKQMLGRQQMEWLKNALLESRYNRNISFRLIAIGSQVLNPLSSKDCLTHFPAEYQELTGFLASYQIPGVLFLTGDRHHSEIIKLDRNGTYPLYDITSSSLTAGIAATTGSEQHNPNRVSPEITEHNFTRISFTGHKTDRKITVTFLNVKGEPLATWSASVKDLSEHRQ